MGFSKSIKTRLVSAFLFCAFLTTVVAWDGIRSSFELTAYLEKQSRVIVPSIRHLAAMDRALLDTLFQTRNAFIAVATPDRFQMLNERRLAARALFEKERDAYQTLELTQQERQLSVEAFQKYDRFKPINDSIIAALAQKELEKAREIGDAQGEPAVRDMVASFERLAQQSRETADQLEAQGIGSSSSSRTTMVVVSVLAVLAALGLGWFLTLSITRPLSQVTIGAAAIARGDVDQTIDYHSEDEIGALAESFRTLVAYFRGIAGAMERLRRGDLTLEVEVRSDKDLVSRNLQAVTSALSGLLKETQSLIAAAEEGDLTKRGESSRFEGAYAELIEGFNRVLEAMVVPVTEASRVLEQVAQHDLTARMVGEYEGDYSKIKVSLNTAVENLHDSLQSISLAVGQVASAAREIASSSQAVAQGASEQAGALEQTSASLQTMSAMTKANASSTNEANRISEAARAASVQGSSAMVTMKDAMGKIRASADGTAAIIRDINEIAFQTNLLALNAAVEAARAGAAGRGFAVVAEEVRNLALRSKGAAKKTESLISDSVQLAREGESVSQQVSANLSEVVDAVSKVSEIIANIAAASAEQSRGIDEVGKAVDQVDKVTQQNAASSEESSSAAEELSGQAQEMATLVGQFRVARRS